MQRVQSLGDTFDEISATTINYLDYIDDEVMIYDYLSRYHGRLIGNSISSDRQPVSNTSTITTNYRSLKIWSVGKAFADASYSNRSCWSVNRWMVIEGAFTNQPCVDESISWYSV